MNILMEIPLKLRINSSGILVPANELEDENTLDLELQFSQDGRIFVNGQMVLVRADEDDNIREDSSES